MVIDRYIDISIDVCMYVWIDISIDINIDGCTGEWIDRYLASRVLLRVKAPRVRFGLTPNPWINPSSG